ncbi:O-antigen ligase family protein [Enterococcus sp. N342-3-1-2]
MNKIDILVPNRKKFDFLNKFSIILITFFLYFWYMFSSLTQMIYLGCILLILIFDSIINNKKIIIKKTTIVMFLIIFFLCFKLFFDRFQSNSLVSLIFYILIFMIKILLDSNKNWGDYFINCNLFFSAIHVIFTWIAIFDTNLVLNINRILLSGSTYWSNNGQFLRGTNPGITGQTGQNAFFICVFIIIISTKILVNIKINKKQLFFQCFCIALGMIALMTTSKRGHLISLIISLFPILFIFFKEQKSYRKYFIFILFLIISGSIIFYNTEYFQIILEKFDQLNDSGDLTNGRLELWKYTFTLFKEAPIIGAGFGVVRSVFNMETHNIYLQLLGETGIVGFILFLALFILFLKNSLKKYKSKNHAILISLFIQVFFLLYGMTGNPLFDYGFFLLYITFCGIAEEEKLNE